MDCPNSIGDNRVRTLDVRLLCGDTSVHSDPITWHDDEPSESAAMQLVHALFSVPQISRKISELTDEHTQMVKSYLSFWRKHRELLLQGELAPLYPHLIYPLVIARNSEEILAAFYGNIPFEYKSDMPSELILVNGTYKPELILDLDSDMGNFTLTSVDCMGVTVADTSMDQTPGLHKIAVPAAGHTYLRKS